MSEYRDCPGCDEHEVEYETAAGRPYYSDPVCFRCPGCGRAYEIEGDGDFDGERFVDCSTPGNEILTGPLARETKEGE